MALLHTSLILTSGKFSTNLSRPDNTYHLTHTTNLTAGAEAREGQFELSAGGRQIVLSGSLRLRR